MPPVQGAIDRIADALRRLADVTDAVQNTSIAVTHVANQHERLANAAHQGAEQVGRLATAAEGAVQALGPAAATAAGAVDRMAGAAERFVTLCEREGPLFVRAVERIAQRGGGDG